MKVKTIIIRGGRYEDKRLPAPWDDAAWKTWKAEKPLTPWGTIPVLDYQGLVIGQSTAASRLTRAETVELQESRQRVLTLFLKGSLLLQFTVFTGIAGFAYHLMLMGVIEN